MQASVRDTLNTWERLALVTSAAVLSVKNSLGRVRGATSATTTISTSRLAFTNLLTLWPFFWVLG
jgi:hypothetical protein